MKPIKVMVARVDKYPRCPACGREADAISSATGPHLPRVGDLNVCDACYAVGYFTSTETYDMRLATPEEAARIVTQLEEAGLLETASLVARRLAARSPKC